MRDIPADKWCERAACTTGLEAKHTHRDNRKKYCHVCAGKINEMNGEKLCDVLPEVSTSFKEKCVELAIKVIKHSLDGQAPSQETVSLAYKVLASRVD